ncbi:MAG: VOC family protein [Bacteroidetes bacterium]|nr:VOC family protein [Bacteroidota bacterium]MBS1629543.1 VOC family protein [Bacteroidota bacterium]
MQHITPCLWFHNEAEEAARFYTSLFPNSSMGLITRNTKDTPGVEGSVMVVSFVLNGQSFTALNGNPQFAFNESISLMLPCHSQEEIDYYWQRLTADGGQESMCGWLKDRFGVSWQVAPSNFDKLLSPKQPTRVARVMRALMKMRKLDLAALERAYQEG